MNKIIGVVLIIVGIFSPNVMAHLFAPYWLEFLIPAQTILASLACFFIGLELVHTKVIEKKETNEDPDAPNLGGDISIWLQYIGDVKEPIDWSKVARGEEDE